MADADIPGESRPSLLFLLRGYPSVDHLAPLIWLTVEDGRFDVRLAGVNLLYDFTTENRIAYFQRRGVVFTDIDAQLTVSLRAMRWIWRRLTVFSETRLIGPLVRKVCDRLQHQLHEWNEAVPAERILHAAAPDGPTLLISDHCTKRLHREIAKVNGRLGGKTVQFPHGILFWTNELRTIGMSHRPDGRTDSGEPFTYLDHFVATNEVEREKAHIGLTDASFRSRISVIGSLRFSRWWVGIRDRHFPAPGYSFPGTGAQSLKILFLCPKRSNNIFWEELVRVVRILASHDDHALCIKGPAQGNETENVGLRQLGLSNVVVISDSHETSALADWADVVLWVDTSAVYEGFLQDKPVAHLKYLWSNLLAVDGHPAMWQAHCRDDVYAIMDRWRADKTFRPYDDADVDDLFQQTVNNVESDPPAEALALIEQLSTREQTDGQADTT